MKEPKLKVGRADVPAEYSGYANEIYQFLTDHLMKGKDIGLSYPDAANILMTGCLRMIAACIAVEDDPADRERACERIAVAVRAELAVIVERKAAGENGTSQAVN